MSTKQTVKELRWKADQHILIAERYRKLASDLEALENELPLDSQQNLVAPEPKKKKLVNENMSRAQKARWARIREERKKEFKH